MVCHLVPFAKVGQYSLLVERQKGSNTQIGSSPNLLRTSPECTQDGVYRERVIQEKVVFINGKCSSKILIHF